jgi:glutathione S-transferase
MHDGLFIRICIRRYESNFRPGEAMYRLIVGTKDWSSWSLRAYLALMATGQPFDEVVIRLRHTDADATKNAIREFSPAGRVPVLQIEEGGESITVWDSLAICETLAERHPAARLWPHDRAARAMARSYSAEMHSGFPDLRDQLSMDFARRLSLPALRPATEAQIARILASWDVALARYGNRGGFLFGHFSIADCMYAPVVSRFTTFDISVSTAVGDYMARVWALPGMQAWLKDAQKEVADGIA